MLLPKLIIFREAFLPTNRGFDSHFGYWGGEETYRLFFDTLFFRNFSGHFPGTLFWDTFDSHFAFWGGGDLWVVPLLAFLIFNFLMDINEHSISLYG